MHRLLCYICIRAARAAPNLVEKKLKIFFEIS